MEPTRISEAQLGGIIDIADDAIISIDESQRIILFNKGAERIFGYSAEEAIGLPLDQLLPVQARASHPDRVRQFGQSANAARRMGDRSEISGRRRDGTEFPAEASISCLQGGPRRIFTAILRDVTEQKRQGQMVRDAKLAAEIAVRAKSMFLANMSHEIRTPLNAVIGMTSLLLHTGLNEEQRDFVETIRSSGDALLTVINEILDFTKIELGSLEIDLHPFDVRRTIEAALDLVAAAASEKNINLAYLVDDSVPPVVVSDGTRLRQVLLNILGNAVKFTRRGEVVVNVDAAASAQSGYELHFSVSDTGIGISQEEQEKLFKPFSQIDATTTREFGGTGLGLAISQRLCEMLGGRIWVDSVPGQGSTFHFTILAQRAAALPAPHLHADPPALVGKRILIVDDNTTNRRVLVRHALKWGMLPQAVASAQEALDLVRHGHALDVAILDMSMPGIDGQQLAHAIRHIRDAQALPLVLLSSLGQRQRGAEEDHKLFAAYLHKPIKLSQLFDVLMTLIGGEEREGEGAQPDLSSDARLADGLPLKILVAEDNRVNQKVALRILAYLGYRADVAATGQEVLEALERQDYDVILMDIQMPGVDGLEATKRIRERYPQRRPYVIAMTANALRGDRERFLASGMDGYLSKPLEIAGLARALQLSREHSKAPVPPQVPPAVHSIIDRAQLSSLRQAENPGTPGLVREIIDHFANEMPAGMGALAEHCANGDVAAISRLAHRLASTALACGATRVADVCRELEQCGDNATLWLCGSLIERLRLEFEAARAALEENQAQHGLHASALPRAN